MNSLLKYHVQRKPFLCIVHWPESKGQLYNLTVTNWNMLIIDTFVFPIMTAFALLSSDGNIWTHKKRPHEHVIMFNDKQ